MKRWPYRRLSDTAEPSEDRRETTWRRACDTMKRQLEEMTQRNNERNNYINSVFSSMEDGFFLIDTEGRIVLFNPRAGRLLDIDGSCLFGIMPDRNDSMNKILDACKELRQGGCPSNFEIQNEHGVDIQVSISPVLSKYGDNSLIGILAIVKDITERKKVENIRKEFVANVSHEFRTPLTLISGFIEMLRMYGDLPAEDRNRSLEILEIETVRLKKLISELLMLSKMENKIPAGDEGLIDIPKTLDQVVTVMSPLAKEKRQTINVSVDVGDSILYGDETWLFHAIRNLVENAIKYTGNLGIIDIEATGKGGELSISVSDNGVGIPEVDLDRIFERFYRVDTSRNSRTGGSGLGLAIAKDIISIFNGRIEVQSQLGIGSRFTIRIPFAAEK
jgi:two-component system phosphate regulon sensor histidine kinase PhoR